MPRKSNDDLSARELEVLELVTQGHSNNEIADKLGISVNTVESHVSNINAKLGVHNRTAATHVAQNQGLIKSGEK